MKQILMIATGGTIASKSGPDGLKPVITSEELLSYVPDAKSFCHVDTLQILNVDSTNIQPKDWLLMADTVQKHYDSYDGFVICHGTDTMAYTASALSYLIQDSLKPIVITGSQRPIDLEITDAKTNLLDSLRFACCSKAHDVSIVFDGKAIAGTRGKKERTKSYNAFSSINFPVLAVIQDEHIMFYIDDKQKKSGSPRFYNTLNENVCLLKLIPSMKPDILNFMADQSDAVIIESFGVGGLPSYDNESFYQTVEKWTSKGKVIVMTTQVTLEGSNMTVYEVGHTIKRELGLIEAYDMTLESTVTKLMWILGQTKDQKQIETMFYQTVNHDILWN